MKKFKRLSSFIITLAIILTFLPNMSIRTYAYSDINIISNTDITAEEAKAWAKTKGATDTFISLADLYWKYAKSNGKVNPAGAYVQSAIETGYGKFGGVLNESYKNPCGLKTSVGGSNTDPNAHQRFSSWDQSVQAHLDHLALYAGANGYPKSGTSDPRHFVSIKGTAKTFGSLGGKWASDAAYGENIIKLYNELLKTSDSSEEEKDSESDKSEDKSQDESVKNEDKQDDDKKTDDDKSSENEKVEEIILKDTVAPQGPTVKDEPLIKYDPTVYTTSSIGWRKQNGSWYYYKSNGAKATGWIKPDKYWYYLYSSGQMAVGWIKSGNTWYYFNPGGDMKIGWLYVNKTWYFLNNNGDMVTGFHRINGNTYYFDGSGAMKTGWVLNNGKWMYFNGSGAMQTGWIAYNGHWYYIYPTGIMATGITIIGGKSYYLYSTGEMAERWIQFADGKYHYYMPGDGFMATNTVIDGWKIGADGARTEKVQVTTPTPTPSKSKLIVIDPGHNFGGDDGAYATSNGIRYSERDLNMQVALKLRDNLQSKGYRVILTRTESDRSTAPVSTSLYNRAKIANDANADFFISIHHNSFDNSNAYGIETYYSDRMSDSAFGSSYNSTRINKSRSFATAINNQLVSATGAYNRGAKESSLYVTRNTKMPSVLVELGFITNPSEAARCASGYYQTLEAQAITQAISSQL